MQPSQGNFKKPYKKLSQILHKIRQGLPPCFHFGETQRTALTVQIAFSNRKSLGETPDVGFSSKTVHRTVFSPFPAFWKRIGVSPIAMGDPVALPPEPLPPFVKGGRKLFSRGVAKIKFSAITTRTGFLNYTGCTLEAASACLPSIPYFSLRRFSKKSFATFGN